MRDRWLRDAFTTGLSSSSNSEQMNSNEYQMLIGKNLIDEDETIRLLSDYGISEEKLKVRLQVNFHVRLTGKYYINELFSLRKFKQKNRKVIVDISPPKNLSMCLKNFRHGRKFIIS